MPRQMLCLALVCLTGLAGCLTDKPASADLTSERDARIKLHAWPDQKNMIETRMTKEQEAYYWGDLPRATGITFWYSPNSGTKQSDAIVIISGNMFAGSLAEIHLLTTLFGYSGTLFHASGPDSLRLPYMIVKTPDAWYHVYELPSSSGAAGVRVYFDATEYHGSF